MITSVYIDTDELVFQLHSVSDDAQKALEWVRSFRDTLMFGARIANPLPFAMECMAMSEGFSASGVLGKLRAAARKRLNDEGIEATPESIDAEIVRTQGADAVREIMAKIERANSLKAEIRRRKFTAAAATREGVDASTTGCNPLTADAPHREGGDERQHPSNGALLESGTSATHYDKEAAPTSTDGPRQAEARQNLGGRGHSPESDSSALKPLPPSKPKKPNVEKHPHGEFQNVMLTDDEYIKACDSIQDCDSMIERMSSYKASSGKKYKSDYAALLNWARRDDDRHSLPQAPMYKTAADRDREEIQKIADYYAAQERGENPPMPKIQLVEGL